jgi:Protein of unknown function (DUF2848)
MQKLEFSAGNQLIVAEIHNLVIAGWTGRDARGVEDHIAELEALGVSRPRQVPCFYRLGSTLLTSEPQVEVCGSESSGEVEFVLVSLPQGLFVGVGSDHTDRKVEAYGVTVSKQVCPKPIAKDLWSFEDVAPHWDELILQSWVTRGNHRELYQEGKVVSMRSPEDLVSRYAGPGKSLPVGTVLYCGTLPVQGKIGSSEEFEVALKDPIRACSLHHAYAVRCLPVCD